MYFDCTFFYQIEFVTIVVPHNYSGKISIKLNDPKSKVHIRPVDKTIVFTINSNGDFATNSDFTIPLNSILITEMTKDAIIPQDHLHLENLQLIKKENYNILNGNIVVY